MHPRTATDTSLAVRDALLIALTFGTGVVDVASYLGLGQIFTANMTGNTVFLAIALGEGNALTGIRSAEALLAFGMGAYLAGRYLDRATGPGPWVREATRVLWVQACLVGTFSLLWFGLRGRPGAEAVYGLIALSAVGMGMQSAVGRKLAVPSTTTNVLTMAFTGLMAELTALGVRGSNARRWASVVLAMAAGAVLGGWLYVHYRAILPIPMLAVLGAVCVLATRYFPASAH